MRYRKADPEVLKSLLKPLKPKQSSASYILSCPKCGKKDKLYLRKKDGRFVCFYCREIHDFQGAPEFALTELLGVPIDDLRAQLYGDPTTAHGGRLQFKLKDFYEGPEEEIEEEEPMPPFVMPSDTYSLHEPCAEQAREYLLGRGITEELWDTYGLLYWPNKRRVVFPVSEGEDTWGYQARTIDREVQPKILTSKGLLRDRLLMFYNRIESGGHAILCEGPVDALKCHLAGGAVATMGKVVTDRQIDKLREKNVSRIYLALDPDAFVETQELAKKLVSDFEVYRMDVPAPYKDFGEMSVEDVYQCFKRAKPYNLAQVQVFLKNPYAYA